MDVELAQLWGNHVLELQTLLRRWGRQQELLLRKHGPGCLPAAGGAHGGCQSWSPPVTATATANSDHVLPATRGVGEAWSVPEEVLFLTPPGSAVPRPGRCMTDTIPEDGPNGPPVGAQASNASSMSSGGHHTRAACRMLSWPPGRPYGNCAHFEGGLGDARRCDTATGMVATPSGGNTPEPCFSEQPSTARYLTSSREADSQPSSRVVVGLDTEGADIVGAFERVTAESKPSQFGPRLSRMNSKGCLVEDGEEEDVSPAPDGKEATCCDLLQQKVYTLTKSKRFEGTTGFIIFVNAIFIGFVSDYQHKHLGEPMPVQIQRVQSALNLFWFVEISTRIFGQRCEFFGGPDMSWNLFDLFLVFISGMDELSNLPIVASPLKVTNLSFVRVVRVLKVLKLLRVVRLMRCFKGLRIVLAGILGAIQPLFYAMLLIVGTTYLFGMAILQSCTTFLETKVASEATRDAIGELWSSVPRSMLSLFMASTSGDSWRILAEPLQEVGPITYAIFVVYLSFFVFVISNTLTSLFVENGIEFAQSDENAVIQEEMEKKGQHIRRFRRFFELIDTDRSGDITYEEFCANLSSPSLQAFATSLGIDILDAKEFFEVLSRSGEQAVDIETFVVGCIKLKGHARSLDLIELSHAYKINSGLLQESQELTLDVVRGIAAKLGVS